MENSVKSRFFRVLLITLFVFSVARVLGFAYQFVQDSLQMDFAAFYTAGQSCKAGLSPYVNGMGQTPPVWDGFALLQHSRFLYPPLAARLFQPFAYMPYGVAKGVWTLLGLICLGYALYLVMRSLWGSVRSQVALCVGIAACWFHPVLTLLERGQVDGVTLLLLVLCVIFAQKDKRRQLAGGGFLALATLLKLHCVYFLPFLILRKQWNVLFGFAGAGVLFALFSLGIDGYDVNQDYVVKQLPRIAVFGEGGTRDQMMSREVIDPYAADLQAGYATKGGIRYRQAAFGFVSSATLVDVVVPQQADGTRTSNPSSVSLGLLVVFGGAVLIWLQKAGMDRRGGFLDIWIVYVTMTTLVLLVSPTSWVMNVVWVLPGLCVLIKYWEENMAGAISPFYMCVLGLLLAALPDHYSFYLLMPYGEIWLEYKYVIAEGLLLIGLLGMVPDRKMAQSGKPSGKR